MLGEGFVQVHRRIHCLDLFELEYRSFHEKFALCMGDGRNIMKDKSVGGRLKHTQKEN